MFLIRRIQMFVKVFVFFIGIGNLHAQENFTGLNNTVINLTCSQTCTNLNFQVPHLRSDDEYDVVTIPYTPYPYTTSTGNELIDLYDDDLYSQSITLPFPICFYGAVYNRVVVGSNGLITFDLANAACRNAFRIGPPIPNNTGTICQASAIYYPKASVMAAYSDLDPTAGASPADRKIEWRFEGVAPFRRFVASWYRVGAWGSPGNCNQLTPATFQIVINEGTAAIDVFFERFICPDGSNGGRAILGVQDFSRTKAKAADNKNATVWTAANEAYRFIPAGATSRFVKSELFELGAPTPLTTATPAIAGSSVNIDFGNICITGMSQQFEVRTTYTSCIDPTQPIIIKDTITVQKTPLAASYATVNTTCGIPNGKITVTIPTGVGVAPFTYVLDPGPGEVTLTGGTPMEFTGVAQGIHTVVVTDATGSCTNTLTDITINRTNDFAVTQTPTATSCAATNDGKITITPTNGAGPFTGTLNPGSIVQTGPGPIIFTGLAPGTYTVSVTENSGCNLDLPPITIISGPGVSTTATHTDVRCNGGATGAITVAPLIIGTPPFEYSLDNVNWQTSNVFNGLIAGPYTVYFRESSGCTGQLTETIGEPTVLDATANVTPVVCNGESNGIFRVTATGGVPPYEYSRDGVNWQASNTFNLPAGIYTITIRDANNCTTTQTRTVTEPAVISANAVSNNATCNGGNDGTITVTAGGGNAGFSYSLDGVNFQTSNVFNVAPGDYDVTVKDDLGCTFIFPATVGLTNNLTFTPQSNATICESKSTQLQLVSNATEYLWSPATGLSSTVISNPVANPTITTLHTVIATLGRCEAVNTVTVNVNAAPIPDAGANGIICFGQSYQLQASGGVQYTWTPATYLDDPNIGNPVSAALKTITYTLAKVVDANGCESLTTDEVKVDVTPPIKVNTFPFDTIGYPGDTFRLRAIAAEPTATNFTWTPGTRLSNSSIADPVVTVGEIGQDILYEVTASSAVGCRGQGYVHVRVFKGPEIYVPTGFTPNGDGRNDKFYPFPVGIKSLTYFRVFNRWGELVFSSTTLHEGWDGTRGGSAQPPGTYIWMAEAITNENKKITKKGTITLIR